MESEFHELVALTEDVVGWEIDFGLAVGGADDVRGLVDAALEGALEGISVSLINGQKLRRLTIVATGSRIRVDGIDAWIIASLTVGGVGAV